MPETDNSSENNKKPEDKSETHPQVEKESKSIKRRILDFFSFLHKKPNNASIAEKETVPESKIEIPSIEKTPSQTPEVASSTHPPAIFDYEKQPIVQPVSPVEVTPPVTPIIHPPEKQVSEISAVTISSKEQPIKASEIDPKFKYELLKISGSENILKCFQCGTCTSDCPVARYTDNYRPRTLIHMATLGLKERVLKSETLWLCSACYTCTDRCPQGVEVASVIRVFRNLAVENGCIPQVFKDQIASIFESGYAFKIPELRIKKRESLGLPPLPLGDTENLRKILKGIKLLDNNQPTGAK